MLLPNKIRNLPTFNATILIVLNRKKTTGENMKKACVKSLKRYRKTSLVDIKKIIKALRKIKKPS